MEININWKGIISEFFSTIGSGLCNNDQGKYFRYLELFYPDK